MSVATVSPRFPRSEPVEVTRQEQESHEMEDAEINLHCGAERHVPERARNIRYGVINDNPCEPVTYAYSWHFSPHPSTSCL